MEILETLLPGVGQAVFNNIQSGNCVLVLGPKISVPDRISAGKLLSIEGYFASKLALPAAETAEETVDLRTAIARHEQHFEGDAILRSLVQQAAAHLDNLTTNLHLDLAALPFRLVVQTTPDRMMINAFREVGKNDAAEDYFNHLDRDRSNVLRSEPSIERPLVYNLFGRHRTSESMVLTDQDLINYLVNLTRGEPELPDIVRSTLKDKRVAFLFIGFGFANWWLRLLLKVLQITGGGGRALSVALEDSASYLQAAGHMRHGVFEKFIYVREGDWNVLARELADRYKEQALQELHQEQSRRAQAESELSPVVFVSYASEDRDFIERLCSFLELDGIQIWRDVQNLRAGEGWESAIRDAIEDADFFLFVQTENMDRGPGIYNEELKVAIEVRKDNPRRAQLVVVRRGQCQPRKEPELQGLHWAQLDAPQGARRLAEDIRNRFEAQLAARGTSPARAVR